MSRPASRLCTQGPLQAPACVLHSSSEAAAPEEPPASSVSLTGSRVCHCPGDTHCGRPQGGCPDPRPGSPRYVTARACARARSAGSALGTPHLRRASRRGRQRWRRCLRCAVSTLLFLASRPVSSRSRGRRLAARQWVHHADVRSSRSLPRGPRLWGPPVGERSPETLPLGHLILSG